MLCEICHEQEVSFIITMSSDSSVREIRVCEECATRNDEHEIPGIPGIRRRTETLKRECPRCHFKYSESALLGCPTCYTEFREELTPVLNRIHGSTNHKGKTKVKQQIEKGNDKAFKLNSTSCVPHSDARWMQGNGPDCDVVFSTRIRLARNISGYSFCNSAEESELFQICTLLESALAEISKNKDSPLYNAANINLRQLSDIDREFLVERYLISRELAEKAKGEELKANSSVPLNLAPYRAIVSKKETLSIMLNEEDHIRLQLINPGLQLRRSWRIINAIDDELGQKIDYAFSPGWGYLTACPTNVGTGLRASVMIHIPALAATKEGNKLLSSISDMGYAIRGIYGEGTQAIGAFYQISNETTLGQPEEDIIDRIGSIIRQIVDLERRERQLLIKKYGIKVEDKILRSYGILMNARLISSREALELLSWIRLGVSLGILPGLEIDCKDSRESDESNGDNGKEGSIKNIRGRITRLLTLTRPAHLQKYDGRKLDTAERDISRAAVIRAILSGDL